MIVPGEEVLLLSSRAQGLSGKGGGGGGGWLDEIDTCISQLICRQTQDSDFFEPLFLGLIYCFSDILLKLMLQHT